VGPQAVVDGEVVTVGGEAIVDPNAPGSARRRRDRDPFPRHRRRVAPAFAQLGGWGWHSPAPSCGCSSSSCSPPCSARRARLGAAHLLARRRGGGVLAAIGIACQIAFLPVLLLLIAVLAVSIVAFR
jgi:hypothetical protein